MSEKKKEFDKEIKRYGLMKANRGARYLATSFFNEFGSYCITAQK